MLSPILRTLLPESGVLLHDGPDLTSIHQRLASKIVPVWPHELWGLGVNTVLKS